MGSLDGRGVGVWYDELLKSSYQKGVSRPTTRRLTNYRKYVYTNSKSHGPFPTKGVYPVRIRCLRKETVPCLPCRGRFAGPILRDTLLPQEKSILYFFVDQYGSYRTMS